MPKKPLEAIEEHFIKVSDPRIEVSPQGRSRCAAAEGREGLYSSLVSKWREQRERSGTAELSEHRRGPKMDANAVLS